MAVTWIDASDTNDPSDPNAEYAASAASWILYKLTAEKYPGIRTTTEWYGRDNNGCWSCLQPHTFSVDGHVHHLLPDDYSGIRVIPLRHFPVISINSVQTVNGTVPSGDYRVANRRFLTRVDRKYWDMYNGVTVAYEYGVRPPEAGLMAAKRLANEFILAAQDSEDCVLPREVQSVTRQGMSFTLMDPQQLIAGGGTGIYEIDLFINAANPSKAKKRAKVFSPDLPRGEHYL